MTVLELRELLADKPDYWKVAVETVTGYGTAAETDYADLAGLSKESFEHVLLLVVEQRYKGDQLA